VNGGPHARCRAAAAGRFRQAGGSDADRGGQVAEQEARPLEDWDSVGVVAWGGWGAAAGE